MKIHKTAFAMILGAALLLAACTATPETTPGPVPEPTPAEETDVTPEPSATPEPEETPEPEPPEPDGLGAMRSAYESALNKLYYDKILPNGDSADEGFDFGMGGDMFAVYDVDFDGSDELVIQHNNASMAGMLEAVYGYDSETGLLVEELTLFPALVWYDNGVIMALFSHNQGLAGRFWPYFLYVYDSERDVYDCVGMVDAWDSSIFDEDYGGKPYPSEIDVSGEGIVYYIMGPDEYNLDNPVDKSDYESWLNGYVEGAQTFEVPLVPLEPENFSQGVSGTHELWEELGGGGGRDYYSAEPD